MCVNRHKDAESGKQGHHRCSAVTDQREWDPDDRKDADDHADVDEDVDEECDGQAAGKQPAECVLGANRDIQAAAAD